MSVRAMTAVWAHREWGANVPSTLDNVPAKSALKSVLLAIADNADEYGRNAWPSIETITEKTELSERTVQRCIARLQELGLLKVVPNAGGDRDCPPDRRPNRYTVLVPGLPERGDNLTPRSGRPRRRAGRHPDTPRGDNTTPRGVSPRTDRGVILTGTGCQDDTQTVLEPPQNHPPTERADALSAPTPEAPAPGRPRDELWDALVEALGHPIATDIERGRANRALKSLRGVGATPDQLHQVARAYRRTYPNVALTPQAIEAHWSELVARAPLVEPSAARPACENPECVNGWIDEPEARAARPCPDCNHPEASNP